MTSADSNEGKYEASKKQKNKKTQDEESSISFSVLLAYL